MRLPQPHILPVMAALLVTASAVQADSVDTSLFTRQIAPLLRERCLRCHDAHKARGGLDMTTREKLLKGGDKGAVVVPGDAGNSLLLAMVTGAEPQMPKQAAPLTQVEVAALRKWINEGATWPPGMILAQAKPRWKTGPDWWSLRKLTRPGLPPVLDRDWLRTPIDAFILAGLEAKGLRPSVPADKRTLIRRATFDLHGLPPAPSEVDAFLGDDAPDAYERLIDRLLASPRYGERWGRHWLDVVHYGDTHGYDKDKRRDHAWPYRDYVIRSFNADKPYGRFVREQLAGDVLFPGDPDGVVATGFIAAGPWDFVGHVELREGTVEKEKTRVLDRDDMVSNTASTFLSLTVHCARCHDHKFDPIPKRDYYRLQAVFAGLDRGDRPCGREHVARQKRDLLARLDDLKKERQALLQIVRQTSGPELGRLEERLQKLEAELAALPQPLTTAASPTNGYHSGIEQKPDIVKWVQVDLGKSLPVDGVRLVPARPTDFPDTPGFGFPVRFQVALAHDAAFARGVVIADYSKADFPNPGVSPFLIPAAGRHARYVRVTAQRLWQRTGDYVFALAELQVASGGKNVALGATVTALDSIEAGRWSMKSLVDNFDSRRRLADLADAQTAAGLQRRADLQREIVQAGKKRQTLLDTLTDTKTREQLGRNAVERAAVEQSLRALPAQDLVYAVLPHAPRPIHLLERGDF